jgi:ribosomal protein S18 acetylase RimI-like enzyme
VGDEHDVACVHVRSWQSAYQGLISQAYLDGLDVKQRAERYSFALHGTSDPWTRLLVRDDKIVGFSTTGPCRDGDAADEGEILALYVEPSEWTTRAGRTLMIDARGQLRERGFTHARLWVLDGNDRAIRFYERGGWSFDGATRVEQWPSLTLSERRMQIDL